MSFTGNEGTFITLSDGGDLTAQFRTDHPEQNKGWFFGKNKLNNILAQTDCVGIRIYFGEDATSGKIKLVLVGAKANCDDQTTGYILDEGTPCPTYCGVNNALNS
jgi:hypothetical protein